MTKTQILARAAGAVLLTASVALLTDAALGQLDHHGAHAAAVTVIVIAGPEIDRLPLAPHPTTTTTRPPATTTTLPPAPQATPVPTTPPATPQWTGTSSSGPDTTTCPTCTAVHDGTSFNYADPTVTVEYPDGSCGQTGQTEAQAGGYLIIPASQCADGTYTGNWVDGHPPYQGPGQPVSGGPAPTTTTVAPTTTTTTVVPATTTTTTQ